MTAIAIIPARGGSRRIPGKNIKMFHGKPIIAYSIEAAKQTGLFDFVWVSTDSPDIAQVALRAGAAIHTRDSALAKDEIGTQEVARDACRIWRSAEYTCCIYATAPMMTTGHLRAGFNLLLNSTGYVYVPGWYYWGRTEWFLEGRPLTPDGEIHAEADRYIDINTPDDWTKAERMYEELKRATTA